MATNSRIGRKSAEGRFGAVPFAAAVLALAVPSAGLALGGFDAPAPKSIAEGVVPFTPAAVDPQLALRVARQIAAKGKALRFTPAAAATTRDRTYTVAVRVDDQTARAFSIRSAIEGVQETSLGTGTVSIAPTRYNLGIARGYQSFAKPEAPKAKLEIGGFEMPDLASFRPSEGAKDKPGRFQTRIALEQDEDAGRAPRTIEGAGEQAVDVGGAYRLSRNLRVTAGVRLSQERDRIAPLTDAEQDSKAVYVGTQFKF